MAKTPKKSGKAWSDKDVSNLKRLAGQNTPTGLMAYELERSQAAVRAKASDEKVSLKPTNQSPDKRRKSK
ncbi:hypothetical protein [Amycolatopsis minnesotensis]|uniref:Uncharacterized protein n=1 Tax=Amycolatopsis minnesotensis TaxID=337894 RepID=A0ABP5BHC6_9PSEU